jgi:hypothetical protein
MSKTNTKIEPVVALTNYYNRYLEFEKAFDNMPKTDSELLEHLAKVLEKEDDLESEAFKSEVVDKIYEREMKRAELSISAERFVTVCDYHVLTTSENLPEIMFKDYQKLKRMQPETTYIVENGQFKRVSTEDIKVPVEYLKQIYDMIKENV